MVNEIELRYDTIRKLLSRAEKLLISGLVAGYTGVLIKAGVLGDEIDVPFINQEIPAPLALSLFVLGGFFFGIGYYVTLSRVMNSVRRLEFDLGEDRQMIESVLSGSSWITTSTFVRKYLLEGNTGSILMAVGIPSLGPLFGLVAGMPYFAALLNSSFAYLSPKPTWTRNLAARWFAFRYCRDLTKSFNIPKSEAEAFQAYARPHIDQQIRKYGLLSFELRSNLSGRWGDLNRWEFFKEWADRRDHEWYKRRGNQEDAGTGDEM